jgi:hypothetical protein
MLQYPGPVPLCWKTGLDQISHIRITVLITAMGREFLIRSNHMQKEAALSRLQGGIHYRFSMDEGLKQGKKVGALVNSLKFRR